MYLDDFDFWNSCRLMGDNLGVGPESGNGDGLGYGYWYGFGMVVGYPYINIKDQIRPFRYRI